MRCRIGFSQRAGAHLASIHALPLGSTSHNANSIVELVPFESILETLISAVDYNLLTFTLLQISCLKFRRFGRFSCKIVKFY